METWDSGHLDRRAFLCPSASYMSAVACNEQKKLNPFEPPPSRLIPYQNLNISLQVFVMECQLYDTFRSRDHAEIW